MRNIVYLSDTQEPEIEQWLNGDNVGNMKIQSSLFIPNFCIDPSMNQKYVKKKIPEHCKKQNLIFLHISNYLHNIYCICIAFTLY